MSESDGSFKRGRWHQGPLLALTACVTGAKKTLRGYLIRKFPIGYEIAFTPGNLDESLGAAIGGHREFVRLMKQPCLRDLLTHYPAVIYRCYRSYLATSFTKKDRREILQRHYRYLASRVSTEFFGDILRNKPRVWQRHIGTDDFAIGLSFTGELHHEGDLLLEFQQNGVPLYHLSFTIAPGHLTGSAAEHVMLIGRVQGTAGQFDAIRRATKKCLDVSPSYLLMAAVEGVSHALNVSVIAGVKNKEQITVNQDDGPAVHFDYDVFWRTYVCTEAGRFYLISVPVPEKPIELISTAHRRRTLSKRRFKSEVSKTSETSFRSYIVESPAECAAVGGPCLEARP